METRELFAYGDGAAKRLHETLSEHPEAIGITFTSISDFPGIRQLLAHLVGADERWYERMQGNVLTTRYEDNPATTLGGLFADWQLRRDRVKELYYSRDAAELPVPVPQKFGQREDLVPMTFDQMIYHLINHQLYHTGQISMALQQASIDPPNFDYAAIMLF